MDTLNSSFIRELELNTLPTTLKFHQIIEGDVNCVVWDAAIVLSKYLEKNNNCKGESVLELGAGLGCAGLTAACLGANVLLTDLPQCVPLLNLNIEKNKECWNKYGSVKAIPLSWESEENIDFSPTKILLADCIYYEESINPLVNTLNKLANSSTEIILCQEMRESELQQKYWNDFLKKMENFFITRYIPLSEQNEEYSSEDILLLKFFKK